MGLASQASVTWEWTDGSVTQVIASWGIAPAIASVVAALLFLTVKYSVLKRKDSFKAAMFMIPFYLAFTAAILALFMVIEAPTAPSLEEFGAGPAVGIILGVFFGVLLIAYIFFMPYFVRRVVKGDTRLSWYHIPLGPLLKKENPPLYFAKKRDYSVRDHYEKAHYDSNESVDSEPNSIGKEGHRTDSSSLEKGQATDTDPSTPRNFRPKGPHERFLKPVAHLPSYHPKRLWGYAKFILLQGVTRDCISHTSPLLAGVHSKAERYDNRVEHLWTYCQVASAMIMVCSLCSQFAFPPFIVSHLLIIYDNFSLLHTDPMMSRTLSVPGLQPMPHIKPPKSAPRLQHQSGFSSWLVSCSVPVSG